MGALRKLAGQTAIYGVSSIVGRLMNYLLTPLYTRVFATDEYGVVTEFYAYVAFLIVFLTYGMETAFFRHGSAAMDSKSRERVFSTSLISILITTAVFIAAMNFGAQGVATTLGYSSHPEYVVLFAWIIGLDVLATIPFARLRLRNKPVVFAGINLASILTNIGLNLFFLLYCPEAYTNPDMLGHDLIQRFYYPEFGIGYIFVANLIASSLKFALLLPWMGAIFRGFDMAIYKKLLRYALPLLVLGLAGIVNETFDRAFFVDLTGLPEDVALSQLGIYGACYKVAMLLSIGIQAYRFAAEPLIFSMTADGNRDRVQADIMLYYFIVALFIGVAIMSFEDVVLLLIGEDFREGRGVIPILLAAYVCFGVVFNLSFWYKLHDKTRFGALIAILGAVVTVVINVWAVPIWGYYGSAWATFAAYFCMMILSFVLGQKYYPIPYPTKKILVYTIAAVGLVAIHKLMGLQGVWSYTAGGLVVVLYGSLIFAGERNRILYRHGKN